MMHELSDRDHCFDCGVELDWILRMQMCTEFPRGIVFLCPVDYALREWRNAA